MNIYNWIYDNFEFIEEIEKKYRNSLSFFLSFKIIHILSLLMLIVILSFIFEKIFVFIFNINTETYNIEYILLIIYIYIISSLLLCRKYAQIMKFSDISKVLERYNLSWEAYFFSTAITLIIHLIMIIQWDFPIVFARTIGFGLDITVFEMVVSWLEPSIKINASLMDFNYKHTNYIKK